MAFRAGFFSIGQAGQMVLGAGVAAWLGGVALPEAIHPLVVILGAAAAGPPGFSFLPS